MLNTSIGVFELNQPKTYRLAFVLFFKNKEDIYLFIHSFLFRTQCLCFFLVILNFYINCLLLFFLASNTMEIECLENCQKNRLVLICDRFNEMETMPGKEH